MPKSYLSQFVGSRVLVRPVKAAQDQWGTILRIDHEYPFRNQADAIRASTFRIVLDEGKTIVTLGLYFKELPTSPFPFGTDKQSVTSAYGAPMAAS